LRGARRRSRSTSSTALRPPLRGRRVVLVHVVRDVVEEERGRVGRGGRRLHVDDVELARAQAAQQALQGRQVEDVLEALAVRLEHDRELAVAPGDLEQALRLQALLPERRPLARPAARDQQRARRVLAEPGAEEGAAAELGDDEALDLVRIDEHVVGERRCVGVREVERDPVVRPERAHLEAERVAQACADRERPRRVDAGAEGCEDAEAPVADLVAEPLDDDSPIGRDGGGRGLLLAEEVEQVPSRALVESVVAL